MEIGDVRVDGHPIARFQEFFSKDLLFIEEEELFQKECTFERLAGAGIDFLIHDGVDCVRRHLHITRCRLDLVFLHISHHLDQKGFGKLHIWIRDEKNVHMIVIHQIKSTEVVSIGVAPILVTLENIDFLIR